MHRKKVGLKALARALVKMVYLTEGFEKIMDAYPPLRKRISVLSHEEIVNAIEEADKLKEARRTVFRLLDEATHESRIRVLR